MCDELITEKDEIVSKYYKILKKTICKGGNPSTLTVRTSHLNDLNKSITENAKRAEILERQGV